MGTKVLTEDEVLERLKRAAEVVREVCEPEFVALFGSYAYSEPREGSDVEVLVVYQDGADETKMKEANATFHQFFGTGLEVLPCTLSQWREALLKRNMFIAEITQKGIPLFSRRPWSEVLVEVDSLLEQSENLYPYEWLERAGHDWGIMQFALSQGWLPEVAYHLQQAVEKWLKAFLLYHGWQLERTHDLEKLLGGAIKHEPSLERYREMCHRVKDFVAARYPGLPNMSSYDELKNR
ncbi:MAG: HEPN domain-containing protein [Candidatus Fervidibacter sp.]|uniref:HEPN domain-containing protein n=1 Tax=Candidatus Fervidibacter sp. TaxID=3100871 RepID=UPI004049A99E